MSWRCRFLVIKFTLRRSFCTGWLCAVVFLFRNWLSSHAVTPVIASAVFTSKGQKNEHSVWMTEKTNPSFCFFQMIQSDLLLECSQTSLLPADLKGFSEMIGISSDSSWDHISYILVPFFYLPDPCVIQNRIQNQFPFVYWSDFVSPPSMKVGKCVFDCESVSKIPRDGFEWNTLWSQFDSRWPSQLIELKKQTNIVLTW